MAYETEYYVDQRVIYNRFTQQMSAEDAEGANSSTLDLLREGDAPVHVIIDVSALDLIAIDLKELTATVDFPRDNKVGWVIVVGDNPLARIVGSLVMQDGHVKSRFVESLDEAVNILERMDATLQHAL